MNRDLVLHLLAAGWKQRWDQATLLDFTTATEGDSTRLAAWVSWADNWGDLYVNGWYCIETHCGKPVSTQIWLGERTALETVKQWARGV